MDLPNPDVGGDRSGSVRYRLPQNIASCPGTVTVGNDRGEIAFLVDIESDLVRVSDIDGQTRCQFHGRALQTGDVVSFLDSQGTALAVLHRSELSPVRDRFSIETEQDIWVVDGQVTAHEYWFHSSDGGIAEVSCRWFRARASFGVQVAPPQSHALVLAATICLDIATTA